MGSRSPAAYGMEPRPVPTARNERKLQQARSGSMKGMAEDRFKRYQTAGNDFLETARTRAEEFLRELAKVTESTQKQAQEQVDDLVAAGRRGTDQLLDVVRREVQTQLSTLGLATKKDLDALERRVTGRAPAKAGGAKKAAKKSPTTKKTSAKKAPAKKASAKKASPAKKAAKAVTPPSSR